MKRLKRCENVSRHEQGESKIQKNFARKDAKIEKFAQFQSHRINLA